MGKRKREDNDSEILHKLEEIRSQLNKRRRQKSQSPPRRRRIRRISSEDETYNPTINVDDSTTNGTTTSASKADTSANTTAATPAAAATPATAGTAAAAGTATTAAAVTAAAGPSTQNNSAVPSTSNQAEEPEIELDESILQLLGDAPKAEVQLGTKVHKDIASRWQEILLKGLLKEVKEKVLKDHLIPANCESLVPPLLNAEVKAALPESLIKKDAFLAERQKQIGIALAALANAMHMMITKEDETKVLKALSDAGRILCDVHYNETKSRRSFIISATNANMKETLLSTNRDKYLFGEKVADTLKSAKSIQRSGADLKQVQRNTNTKFNKSNFYKKPLNTRAPQRKTSGKPEVGKPRAAAPAAATTTRGPKPSAARRARASPPPRRSARR